MNTPSIVGYGFARQLVDRPVVPPLVFSNPAKSMYERLALQIQQFEKDLDEQHETAARMVSFGQETTFHIENMGYLGSDTITFFGRNEMGEKVQLIQHLSQLSILLVAVVKRSEKPNRIGFISDHEATSAESLPK
jgi:hypothetical protein